MLNDRIASCLNQHSISTTLPTFQQNGIPTIGQNNHFFGFLLIRVEMATRIVDYWRA